MGWPSHCPKCQSEKLKIQQRIQGRGPNRRVFFDTVCEKCKHVVNKDV